MSLDFSTTTHGKWILTGEHSVVRGNPAIVFPVKSKQLQFSYQKVGNQLTADFGGDTGQDAHLLFWSVLEHGMHLIGRSINEIQGHFKLNNNIPVGAGMGASAALCVAVTRWFAKQGFIDIQQSFNFAKKLEDLFHGKSSGLDIAGCDSKSGLIFYHDEFVTIEPLWQPRWYLSFCGQIGITSHCIKKVEALWEKNEKLGKALDSQMTLSVDKAISALQSHNGLDELKKAISLSYDCFMQWNLISDTMKNHIETLTNNGAIAAKPTGSGDGGYVLSLWQSAPPRLSFDLFAA
jgi:mevalonate kinase